MLITISGVGGGARQDAYARPMDAWALVQPRSSLCVHFSMDLLSLNCPILLSVHRRLFSRKVQLRP